MAHPILTATEQLHAVLTEVAEVNPTFMATSDKAAALCALGRVQARLDELRLRVLAGAGEVAAETGSRDGAAWLSHTTRVRVHDARADLRLARSLETRYLAVALGLREGRVNLAQAVVITQSLDDLPRDTPGDLVAEAEQVLVGYAETFEPRQLARLGRRILDVVAPNIAEAAEARRLAALEDDARRRTRLTLRRNGDGTTRLTGLISDACATRLATYLEAFTNPRKRIDPLDAADPLVRLTYPRRLGTAFCHLIECLDPTRLPLHAGDATTVVVTVTLESLRSELATATLTGASTLPGPDATFDTITASQARRLACSAGILPAVLGGPSAVLDLGRTQRLFSPAQRRALLLRDQTCRAEGCDIPGTWSEAHHWAPWSASGPTSLDNGVLLCSYHHHRAHDPAFDATRLPSGDVRYHRRR